MLANGPTDDSSIYLVILADGIHTTFRGAKGRANTSTHIFSNFKSSGTGKAKTYNAAKNTAHSTSGHGINANLAAAGNQPIRNLALRKYHLKRFIGLKINPVQSRTVHVHI